jgi:hypothetical protein
VRDRRLLAALVLLGFILIGLHVRRIREEALARGTTRISTERRLRRLVHDVMRRDGALDHALTLSFDIDLPDVTTIELAPSVKITGGPIAFDVLQRPVDLQIGSERDRTTIAFAPPPPALGAQRQITIAFSTDAPAPTFGWGHRAVAIPWATTLVPSRVPASVQSHVIGSTDAPGWRCSEDLEGRICTTDTKRRRLLAAPIERFDDTKHKLAFVFVIVMAITALMAAIYRRWALLAESMGMRDENVTPTMDEFIDRVRKEYRARRSSFPGREEVDPLEAVALIARGITAVLGLIASVFLLSHFENGMFPISAPIALSAWIVLAATTIVLAVGFARPRPSLALVLLLAIGAIALHPAMQWIRAGIPPLIAAVLMQLTAKR